MSERERLRERVAREFLAAYLGWPVQSTVDEVWDDFARADKLTGFYEAADRILADPEIARWWQIAERLPVAWVIQNEDGSYTSAHVHRSNAERDAAEIAEHYVVDVSVVPLVPLTTEPSK